MTKDELLNEIARSRAALARDFTAVTDELNLVAKVNRSIAARPALWMGVAAAVGWMAAGPRTKTRVIRTGGPPVKGDKKLRVKESRPLGLIGVVLAALKIASPMLKPALTAYAAKRFAEMAEKLAK